MSQAVEEEQERLGDAQRQQCKDFQSIQAVCNQQQQHIQASSTKSQGIVATAAQEERQALYGAAASTGTRAQSEAGVLCRQAADSSLTEAASILPASISDLDQQHSSSNQAQALLSTAVVSCADAQSLCSAPLFKPEAGSTCDADAPHQQTLQLGALSPLDARTYRAVEDRFSALEDASAAHKHLLVVS